MTLVHYFAYIFCHTYLKIIKLVPSEQDFREKKNYLKWKSDMKVMVEMNWIVYIPAQSTDRSMPTRANLVPFFLTYFPKTLAPA